MTFTTSWTSNTSTRLSWLTSSVPPGGSGVAVANAAVGDEVDDAVDDGAAVAEEDGVLVGKGLAVAVEGKVAVGEEVNVAAADDVAVGEGEGVLVADGLGVVVEGCGPRTRMTDPEAKSAR